MTAVRVSRLASFAIVAVLALGWRLPLGWAAWTATAIVLAGLLGAALKTAPDRTSALAAACIGGVAAIELGYAAIALMRPGAFEAVSRLGYPLLVATGLRLAGGAVLLGLCAAVSVIPVLFPDEASAPDRQPASGSGRSA
jgi:hypothetical protein